MSSIRKAQDRSTASSGNLPIGPGEPSGTVYVLQHEIEADEGDDIKLIGVYRSLRDAEVAIERARLLPGFLDHPEGFSIDAYEVGQDHWTTGFVTVASRSEEPTGRAA